MVIMWRQVLKKEFHDIIINETPKEIQVSENDKNEEILISYVTMGKGQNRKNIAIDNIFAYNIAIEIIRQDEDLEKICRGM